MITPVFQSLEVATEATSDIGLYFVNEHVMPCIGDQCLPPQNEWSAGSVPPAYFDGSATNVLWQVLEQK